MRIPDTVSPLRCKVTVGLEQRSCERDCPDEADIVGSNTGVEWAWGRTLVAREANPPSFDEEAGRTRGTNWSDMGGGLAIMTWLP